MRLIGAAGFEGTLGRGAPVEETLAEVGRFVHELRLLGEEILAEGLAGGLLLSAGGSCFFDVVTEVLADEWPAGSDVLVLLRAGGYACHDHGMLARWSPFVRGSAPGSVRPALELWARVLSRPQPDLALVDAGRRDCSTDADLPVVTAVRRGGESLPTRGLSIVACNDQHAYVSIAGGSDLAPGDLVGLGISHCCTTLDKWRAIATVDDDGRLTGVARTYF